MAFEPGQTVILDTGRGRQIIKVARVTPTGQIVLDNGQRFRQSGSPTGDDPYSRMLIYVPTPEQLEQVRHENRVRWLNRGVSWSSLDPDTVRQVAALIKAAQNRRAEKQVGLTDNAESA